MRDLLFSLTRNRFMALLVGVIVTVILGSSTASSILLVRFASSGIILLEQALGILMGLNIGTTITVQILAFKVLDYAILIVGIGFFLMHLFPYFQHFLKTSNVMNRWHLLLFEHNSYSDQMIH